MLTASWRALGTRLPLAPGVHAPSRFSALLAAAMSDCGDRTVIDAGCGAGLITIAALRAGAAHVIAIDADPVAVELTRHNVARTLGDAVAARLTARCLDFRELSHVPADLLAVNPPQRPASILEAVEPDQRHLHEGGGPDGLQTLRLVLRHARTTVVRTTGADVLPIGAVHRGSRWGPAHRVHQEVVSMHPAWHPLTGAEAPVSVWDFRGPEAGPAGPSAGRTGPAGR